VNASPLGMKDSDPLLIPAGHLDEGRAVCDAVYAPAVRPGLSE
jgi:shikimate 5-dehydrogenase